MGENVFNRPTRLVPGAHGQKLERQTFSLSVKSGSSEGMRRDFDGDCVRIGAGPGNDLALSDATVSSAHFEIAVVERGFLVRDLGSTNGTTLNGVRIVEAYLPSEAEITAGEVRLQFKAASETVESPLSQHESCGAAVGRSPLMREIFARVERVAKTDVTVLITGETGCGKEVIAYSVYEASNRRDGPFVVVDCGAIAPTLIESELFGHEKGAFTGAVNRRLGAFERATGGTLFLDEVGELDMGLQPKLLRALERREIQRVGGTTTVVADTRIIAATNRDLRSMVARGEFREDLYYRLAVVNIAIPPLRERREDIELLVDAFLVQLGKTRSDLPAGALQRFMDHDWPGNARELKNAVERSVVLGELVAPVRTSASSAAGEDPAPSCSLQIPFKEQKAELIEKFERSYTKSLLEHHKGNVSAAARQAGIDRMSLHKLINKYQIANVRD
ncbi:MAG: sigma 54-dependent Fis family transcriptional regulator [Deltaproteobacteria bacterium]|nr:sigma 54-dependent Fis family transcriptional regulator [Deltaproteobacteria bacterium]